MMQLEVQVNGVLVVGGFFGVARGAIIQGLVEVLLLFFFFKQKTAYEIKCDWSSDVCSSDLFRASTMESAVKLLAMGKRHRAKPNDLIRAATVFTALSIVDALNRFVLPKTKIDQLIVSGGGAHNPLILAQLAAALPQIEIVRSPELVIPEDAQEAFAFAILAYETFHGRPSNLPSATGARRPAVPAKISYPPPG